MDDKHTVMNDDVKDKFRLYTAIRTFLCEKNVLTLEVSMEDLAVVHVLDG